MPTAATTNAISGTTTIEYSKDGKAWTTDLSSLTATHVNDSCTIQVRATNPNYANTATGSAELTITPHAATITITGHTSTVTYTGEKQSVTGFDHSTTDELLNSEGYSLEPKVVLIDDDDPGYIAEGTEVGTYDMKYNGKKLSEVSWSLGNSSATHKADKNDYTITFTVTDGWLKIEPREVTVSVEDKTVEYNGSEQQGNTATTFTNVVSGQTATIGYTASKGTLVDTYDNGAYADDFKVVDGDGNDVTANYTLGTQTKGKLIITDRTEKYEITVVAKSTEVPYDGQPHSAEGFETLEFTVEGNTYTVSGLTTSNPSSTDACRISNKISGTAVVKDANGNDVTAQFDVKTKNGELHITTVELRLEITNYEGVYDGESHSGSVKVFGINDTDITDQVKITYNASETPPTITNVYYKDGAVSAHSYSLIIDAGSNYTHKIPYGTLTLKVTPRPVTFTGETATKQYTGSEIELTGVTVSSGENEGLVSGHTHNVTYSAKGTDIGEYDGTITAKADVVIKNGDTDVTANYEITVVNGKLTIEGVEISGTKTWEDAGEATRPESITINLMQKVKGTNDKVTLAQTKTVTAEDEWKYSFTAPKCDADGNELEYSISEDAVEGYKAYINGYDVTNVLQGALTISKKVVDGPDEDTAFSFNAKITLQRIRSISDLTDLIDLFLRDGGEHISSEDANRVNTQVINQLLGNVPPEGKEISFDVTIKLKDGESFTLAPLSYGVTYVITENGTVGYIASSGEKSSSLGGELSVNGMVSGNSAVEFTNTYRPNGTLTISKTVVDAPEADKDKDFNFTLEMTLKDPDGLSISDVTAMIDRALKSDSTSLFSAEDAQRITQEMIAALLNGTPKEFSFTADFTLKGGETATIEDLGYGTTYTITEAGTEGYIASSGEQTGSLGGALTVSGEMQGDAAVEFTNTYRPNGTLTIKKTNVRGAAGDEFNFTMNMTLKDPDGLSISDVTAMIDRGLKSDSSKLFSAEDAQRITKEMINALLNGTPKEFSFTADFTLKGGETATIEDLGYGTTFTITEAGTANYVPSSGEQTGRLGGPLTVSGEMKGDTDVEFTNTYVTPPVPPVTVNYVFTWPGGAAPAGAPTPPAAATVNRGANYTVSTATYDDIPYGIAPNGNVITVLHFQGWNPSGTINNIQSNRTIVGTWTIQMVWYTVTYTDGVPGEVVFPDQVTTTLRIGANTPAFAGTPTREGFNFTGWAPAVSPTVTGNNVYTAQWAPIEEEQIVEPTPEPTPVVEEEIVDEEVPQAAPAAAWALINLLAALGTVATAVGMIITFFKKKDDDDDGTKANPDEESDENKGKKSKFLGLIPAVASVIIFILTENMHNPMTLVDKWTIPMVLILAANGIVAYLTRNKKPEDEDTEKAAG